MLTRPQRRTLVDLFSPNPNGPTIPIKGFIVGRLVQKGLVEGHIPYRPNTEYRLTEAGKRELNKITLSYQLICKRYRA